MRWRGGHLGDEGNLEASRTWATSMANNSSPSLNVMYWRVSVIIFSFLLRLIGGEFPVVRICAAAVGIQFNAGAGAPYGAVHLG
jgi:hypothetical protein